MNPIEIINLYQNKLDALYKICREMGSKKREYRKKEDCLKKIISLIETAQSFDEGVLKGDAAEDNDISFLKEYDIDSIQKEIEKKSNEDLD